MPVLKSRYENVKVWRPDGTLYAEGKCEFSANHWIFAASNDAMQKAFTAFYDEFNRSPEPGQIVIEVCVGLSCVIATLYELP